MQKKWPFIFLASGLVALLIWGRSKLKINKNKMNGTSMTHIEGFSFCGLRRLNQFKSTSGNGVNSWIKEREWYQCKPVNIFIGANGAGKSTVLELIDILRDSKRIATLPRENREIGSLTCFDVKFKDGGKLVGIATPNLIADIQIASNAKGLRETDVQCIEIQGSTDSGNFIFRRNISKLELDRVSESELNYAFSLFKAKVVYWSMESIPYTQHLVAELNAAQILLGGVLSNSWMQREDGRLEVYLSDDELQPNRIATSTLPAGWRQLASFLTWLKNVPQGSICLVEEPETHLHPHLQRYLAKEIDKIAHERTLQLFISTHSSVFQQRSLWPHGASLFQINSEKLSELNSAWEILDSLGIKGSDLSQSNGVIWVEGPSDRMYIKHWLEIYCKEFNLQEPKENVEYSFSFYGGASLSHFGVDEAEAFIDVLSINRNFMIMMDRDDDFSVDDFGNMFCLNDKLSKARIIDEVKSLSKNKNFVWVTDFYTIESYLPSYMVKKHFDLNCGKLELKKNHKKVPIANEYIKIYKDFKTCAEPLLSVNLDLYMRRLYKCINHWNQ